MSITYKAAYKLLETIGKKQGFKKLTGKQLAAARANIKLAQKASAMARKKNLTQATKLMKTDAYAKAKANISKADVQKWAKRTAITGYGAAVAAGVYAEAEKKKAMIAASKPKPAKLEPNVGRSQQSVREFNLRRVKKMLDQQANTQRVEELNGKNRVGGRRTTGRV